MRLINQALLGGAAFALAAALAACGPKAPADPGLAREDFGTGVRLGMPSADAEAAADKQRDWLTASVLTHDDLAGRNAYAERPPDKDLLLALFVSAVPGEAQPGAAAYGPVDELRCYLAPPGTSRLTLLGKPLAPLTPQDVTALLGTPQSRTDSNDGRVHLTFRFKQKERGKPDLSLTTSHEIDGHCFAVELSEVQKM